LSARQPWGLKPDQGWVHLKSDGAILWEKMHSKSWWFVASKMCF
jgi:hypothetical protein